MNEIIECKYCEGRGQVKRNFNKPLEVCPRCKGKKGTPIFPDDFPPRPWIVRKSDQWGFCIVSQKTGYIIASGICTRYVARQLANSPIMYAALRKISSMESGETYDEMCDVYMDCSTCDEMRNLADEALNFEIFKSTQGKGER